MDKNLAGFLALAAFTLAACATPRQDANTDLGKWAGQYGYKPYTFQGKDAYCHAPVGASGSFCLSSSAMAEFMAKNEAPPVPRNLGAVSGDPLAGR